MHFLLCSDGTPEGEGAARFAAPLAEAVGARVTLLGVAEREEDRQPLTRAMEEQRDTFTELSGVSPEMLVRAGDPTQEILARTRSEPPDLVIIGARRKAGTGTYWRSARAYEIVRAVPPPVLVVVGRRERLGRVLVCAGSERYLQPAVRLTSRLAAPAGARATLLRVLPEVPATTVGLPRVPEDAPPGTPTPGDGSGAGDPPPPDGAALVAAGVPTEVRLRRGLVLQEIAAELSAGEYDLVVTGMSLVEGPVHAYALGDVTRELINRAGCPILVTRADRKGGTRRPTTGVRRSGLSQTLRGWLGTAAEG